MDFVLCYILQQEHKRRIKFLGKKEYILGNQSWDLTKSSWIFLQSQNIGTGIDVIP